RVEVVAHEREFVLRRVAGMDAELGGWQLKDQPAIRGVVALDKVPAEHVAQCSAQPLSLTRVEEHVRADDRHAVMLRPRMASRRLSRAVAGTERVVIVRSRVSSGDCETRWVGLSGAVASLVSSVSRVTLQVTGRVGC